VVVRLGRSLVVVGSAAVGRMYLHRPLNRDGGARLSAACAAGVGAVIGGIGRCLYGSVWV
jgi:hypothetical protein